MDSISSKSAENRLAALWQRFAPDRNGFSIVVLLFLSLLFTYPTISQLSTHLIGGTADGWQFPWNNFIFRERVLHGKDPYFTDSVFYPVGVSLILHGYTELNDVIGLALSPFFNDVAVTNLMVILATYLSGLGMYLLALELTKNRVAALFAAIAFAFCPFRMIRITGHIHMALTQFLPFAIWAFLKMGETDKLRYSFLTAFFFALACYCNYYYVIYLILAFLLMLFYGLIRYPHWRTFTFLRSLILSGVLAVIFLLPVLFHVYALLKEGTTASYMGREEFFARQSATIWQYLKISPINSFLQDAFGKSPLIWPYSKITPGWTTLCCGIGGLGYILRNRPRYFGVLLFMGFGFFLLSLGPHLQIGEKFQLPLLYSLVMKIPFVNHARLPERFAIMVNLVTSLVAAYFFSQILKRLSGLPRKLISLTIFGLLLLEMYSVPFPMEAFDPPKIFYQLARSEGEAMLTMPFYPGDIRAKNYMRFQIVHHKKLLDGRVSRNPWLPIKYIESVPVAKTFRSLTIGNRPDHDRVELDRVVAPFFREFFNLRYLTLYPPFSYRPEILNYVQMVFPDAELLSNEKGILAYRLPDPRIQSFQFNRENNGILFFLYDNWEIDRRGYRIVCRTGSAKLLLPDAKHGEMLRVKLTMRTRNPEPKNRMIRLEIGDYFISQESLKGNLRPWRMEIPGDVLIQKGRIAEIEIEKGPPNSAIELQSVETEIVPR
jgi:Dolichyl-phosphate-mannose-protein mannosyltransferase